jgi:excisionase family DNA binding protein
MSAITKHPTPSTTSAPVRGSSSGTLSIGDAARLLGVSIKTIRRWEADGRIRAVRTAGGHRRFPLEDLTQLHGKSRERAASTPQLRTAVLPSRPLPALERLLRTRWHAALMRATRHIYGEYRPGWFRSAAAGPHLNAFASSLGNAATTGDWQLVIPATTMLMVRAAGADGGPTYQETFMFLRVVRAVLIRELSLHDEAAPLELTKLFEAIENEAASNAGRFFETTAEQTPEPPAPDEAAHRIPARATLAARTACQSLAGAPACCGALILAGQQSRHRLEVVSIAGLDLGDPAWFTISDDPLSAALHGGTASFVHSTIATRRLPLASNPERSLPIVASDGPSVNLLVATVVLIRSGAEVESGVLGPLADLNSRVASLIAGAGADADLNSELARVAAYLG